MTVRRIKIDRSKIPVRIYGGVQKGRPPSHVINVRDEDGMIVEQVAFHGFEGRELDAAVRAYEAIVMHGADRDGFLWGKLFNDILSRTDPTFEHCQRMEPITNEELGSARFIQW